MWFYLFVLLLIVGIVLHRRVGLGSMLFPLAYFLYTRTRLGYLYHLHQLSSAKKTGTFHSKVTAYAYPGLKIIPVAIISDNYSYVVIDTVNNIAAAVDPSDPQTVQNVLLKEKVQLDSVLTTHKHWDHSGGNEVLKQKIPGLKVYGSIQDNPPGTSRHIGDGDDIHVGSMTFRVIHTPGHTVGHVVYVLNGAPFSAPDCLFSGDHLFIGGTGQNFEGTPLSMLRSLKKIMTLKEDTLVWPGHEYSLKNLRFAASVEPQNTATLKKLEDLNKAATKNHTSVPSVLSEERQFNPFLRTHVAEVLRYTGVREDHNESTEDFLARVFQTLRERKNKF